MCPLSRHKEHSGKRFRDCSPLQHPGIILFMQTSVCTSMASCQEVQAVDILPLHKRTEGEKIPHWESIPPTLDICCTDGERPSWLLQPPLLSTGRNRHFQGAVNLIYISTLLRMKSVMPYSYLFHSTGYRQSRILA